MTTAVVVEILEFTPRVFTARVVFNDTSVLEPVLAKISMIFDVPGANVKSSQVSSFVDPGARIRPYIPASSILKFEKFVSGALPLTHIMSDVIRILSVVPGFWIT